MNARAELGNLLGASIEVRGQYWMLIAIEDDDAVFENEDERILRMTVWDALRHIKAAIRKYRTAEDHEQHGENAARVQVDRQREDLA